MHCAEILTNSPGAESTAEISLIELGYDDAHHWRRGVPGDRVKFVNEHCTPLAGGETLRVTLTLAMPSFTSLRRSKTASSRMFSERTLAKLGYDARRISAIDFPQSDIRAEKRTVCVLMGRVIVGRRKKSANASCPVTLPARVVAAAESVIDLNDCADHLVRLARRQNAQPRLLRIRFSGRP